VTALRVRTWPAEVGDPLTSYLPATGGLAWLQGRDGLVGWGEAWRHSPGPGTDRFDAAAGAWSRTVAAAEVGDPVGVDGSGLVALGSFTFDARSHGSSLIVPEVLVGRRGGRGFVTAVTADGSEPERPTPVSAPAPDDAEADRPRYAGSSSPDVRWLEAVASAVERIDAGELEKVVLARDHAVWSKVPFDARVLARRLNRRFPGCLTFVVDGLVGATPELLVRRSGREIESLALAGTAPRGATEAEDEALGAALLASEKDRHEHRLLADDLAAELAELCDQVAHADTPHLLRLDNVMHLATRFRGHLREDAPTALEVAGRIHPTPAVGGVPTDRAVELIRELEGMDRGRYAGPVGWVDAAGDGEWGIALRCAELSGARARLFAGAGIVHGSLPEDELEETRVKLLAMRSAFQPPA
jgi:menaquinone-specific isochorismate synthase